MYMRVAVGHTRVAVRHMHVTCHSPSWHTHVIQYTSIVSILKNHWALIICLIILYYPTRGLQMFVLFVAIVVVEAILFEPP